MQVTAILTPDSDGGFTALNPETGTITQGDTLEEAVANLREAVELYLEEFPLNLGAAPFVTTLSIGADA